MGPPEACHVGSSKSGTVKKTVKRSAHVIMPLCRIRNFFLLHLDGDAEVSGGEVCNLQRSSQKSKYKANLFHRRHSQFEKNRPREHQHR